METELSREDYGKVTTLSQGAAERTHADTRHSQILKLGKLIGERDRRRELCPQGLKRWVVNLTDRTLTPAQEEVLQLGLNFTPAPTRFPLVDAMAVVEEGARGLREEEADVLRGRVCGIRRRAMLPMDKLTQKQRKALKELRGLDDEVILPADKGNATVVMKEDYETKIRGMLETSTYRQLQRHPTATQENRLSHKLKGLEKCGEIPGHLYHVLRPLGSQLPRIYGIP